MSDLQTILVALGVPALFGFPVWVARALLSRLLQHTEVVEKQLDKQTELLTILVERDRARHPYRDDRKA